MSLPALIAARTQWERIVVSCAGVRFSVLKKAELSWARTLPLTPKTKGVVEMWRRGDSPGSLRAHCARRAAFSAA
eukprot:2413528-Rhodomonas_salina.3